MAKKILLILLGLFAVTLGAERMVLGELFTSTTCSPCVAGNAVLTGVLSQKGSYLAVVRYHMYWPEPGNDPFYHYNVTDNSARRTFYGGVINYVPRLMIDGSDADGSSESGMWGTWIDDRHGTDSPLFMGLYRNFQSAFLAGQGDGSALVTVTNERDDTTFTIELFGALTESDVAYTGTNGDPTHHQVMIDLLPPVVGTYGTEMTLGPSETKTLSFDFSIFDTIPLPEPVGGEHIVNSDNCELVFWSQIYSTKEVLQAVKVAVPGHKELTLSDVEFVDASGDGIFAPGEQAEVHVTVTNASSAKLNNVKVFLEVDNDDVLIVNGVAEIGSLDAGASYTLQGDELLLEAGEDYNGASFNISCHAGSGDGSLGSVVKSLGVAEQPAIESVFTFPSIAAPGSSINLAPSAGLSGLIRIEMFDATGRLANNLYSGPASELSMIQLPHATAGLYFIRIMTAAGTQTTKIVLLN